MTPEDPRHGQYRGYQQHLRDGEKPSEVCSPCHDAMRRYQRIRPHLHALGRPPRVPIGNLAYRNIATLAARMTVNEIEAATGISDSQINYVLKGGPTANILRRSRTRYEALDVGGIIATHLSHVGTVRRVQALHAIGYTTGQIAAETGLCADAIVTLRKRAKWSSATTRRKVSAAYERLHMKPQPRKNRYAARFYNLATREGYAPPLAWDDIDDPDERPAAMTERAGRKGYVDHAAVERRLSGDRTVRVTTDEALEVVRRAYRTGRGPAWIERELGLKAERYLTLADFEAGLRGVA